MHRFFLVFLTLVAYTAWSCKPSGEGLLLVANKSDNSLFFINGQTMKLVDSTTTGLSPHEVITTPDGSLAFTANMEGNSLSVIDVDALKEVRSIELAPYKTPHGLAMTADGETLFVTVEGSQAVLELSVSSGEVSRVFKTEQEGTHMLALTPDEETLYAANLGSGTTTVIDLKSGQVLKTLATGEGTEGIAVRPDGKEIWVSARSGSVAIIDAESREITDRLPAGGLPIRVEFTPDGKMALVSCMQAGEVIVFDVASRKPLKQIKTGNGTVGIQVRPDGKCAFIANSEANNVSVLDLASLSVTETISAGRTPDGMAFATGN